MPQKLKSETSNSSKSKRTCTSKTTIISTNKTTTKSKSASTTRSKGVTSRSKSTHKSTNTSTSKYSNLSRSSHSNIDTNQNENRILSSIPTEIINKIRSKIKFTTTNKLKRKYTNKNIFKSKLTYNESRFHSKQNMTKPLELHNNEMLKYLINNFGLNLNCKSIQLVNLHHFFDGLQAHRAFFSSIGATAMVATLDSYLDKVVEIICTTKHPLYRLGLHKRYNSLEQLPNRSHLHFEFQ